MEQARKPVAGDIYHHFKDKMYEVVTIAIHSETEEEMVVYQQLYGEGLTYVRPLSMFLSQVDSEKYPDVTQKYRFELVPEVKKEEQVDAILMEYLDARGALEKLMVLDKTDAVHLNDRIITNMSTAVDLVIEDGPIEERLSQLKECLRTTAYFEGARLR